jgi:hypothetical protein
MHCFAAFSIIGIIGLWTLYILFLFSSHSTLPVVSSPLVGLQRSPLALFDPSQRPEGRVPSSSSFRFPSLHSSPVTNLGAHLSTHAA